MFVKLEESSGNGPYISSAILKMNQTQYDIRNTNQSFVKINQTDPSSPVSGEKCDINVNVIWQGKTPEKVYISQGNGNILESTTGMFTGIDFGNIFDGGNKPIFIYAKATDGTITDLFYTQIQVNEVSYGDWFPDSGIDGLNFKLFRSTKFTIPQNVPVFGDTEIGLDLDFIPISIEYEGNKVKLVYGAKIQQDGNGKFKDFSFDKFKEDFKLSLIHI